MSRYIHALIIMLFVLTGCATNTYNVPYIDSKETVQLTVGMSKYDVLDILGNPLYVEMGDSDTEIILWVYEVRGSNVKSNLLPSGQMEVNKYHLDSRPTEPIHRLQLEFKANRLVKWEPINNDNPTASEEAQDESNIQSEPKDTLYVKLIDNIETAIIGSLSDANKDKVDNEKSSKKTFFYEPKIHIYPLEYNYDGSYDYQSSYNQNNINESKDVFFYGCFVGYKYGDRMMGFDIEYDFEENFSFMFRYDQTELTSMNLNLSVAFGIWTYEETFMDYSSPYYNYTWVTMEEFGIAKVGLGKRFNYSGVSILPSINFMLGDDFYTSYSLQLGF